MTRRLFWWWMIPVLLLTFWLGAHNLNTRPLWSDEINSVKTNFDSTDGHLLTPSESWDRKAVNDPRAASLFFVFLNLWGRVVGWQPAILRALSLMIGLLAVAFTYRLGRDWISPRVGLFATVVLAVSAFYIRYLTEIRYYALIALVCAVTVWAYVRIVNARRPPSLGVWAALLVGAVATLYTHYLATAPLVAVGVYHLLFAPRNRRWWQVTGVVALAALAYLPWIPYQLAALRIASADDGLHETALSTPRALRDFLAMFGNATLVPTVLLIAAAVVFALRGRLTRNVRQLLFVALVALAFILGTNQVLQIMHGGRLRYFMPIWPLFALVVGVGIAWLRRWPLMAGVLALWMVIGLWGTLIGDVTYNLDGSNVNFPVQRVATLIQSQAQPNDLVVNYLSDDEEWTSFYGLTNQWYFNPLHVSATMALGDSTHERPQDEAALLSTIEEHPRVWIAYRRDAIPRSLAALETDISQTLQRCKSLSESVVAVDLYVASSAACAP